MFNDKILLYVTQPDLRTELQPVADARFGLEVDRVGGIVLDFLAELVDSDTEVLHFIAVFRSPNGLKEFAVWNRAVGMSDEIPEEIELFRAQADFAVLGNHFPGVEVYLHAAEFQAVLDRALSGDGAAEMRADAGQKFRSTIGL